MAEILAAGAQFYASRGVATVAHPVLGAPFPWYLVFVSGAP